YFYARPQLYNFSRFTALFVVLHLARLHRISGYRAGFIKASRLKVITIIFFTLPNE
ncbi:MAG: hypothetical protein ACI9T7_003478, partial [Oleiphilaceae bacterium]